MGVRRVAVVCWGAALLVAAGGAQAQAMKPGLWEYRSTMKSQSGKMEASMAEMHKQMASMPPEQRRQMEQMLAQSGMQMGQGSGGAQVMRACITPAEASNFDVQSDPDCKQQVVQRSGNVVRIRFSCGGEVPSQGEGTLTFNGDSGFSGKFRVETRAPGEADRMDITQEGRWLGANCGSVQPRR
jgi:hypothetical protein